MAPDTDTGIDLHTEILRYLSAVQAVRDLRDADFLRYGSAQDCEREQQRIARASGIVARVNAYGRKG